MSNAEPHFELVVCPDADHLAMAAAERIARLADEAVQARGRFTLALAGGSTPEKTYALLAGPEHGSRIDWSRTYLFFGDERCVPHNDARSNYHMAERALLGRAPIAADHVFPIPMHENSPADAAGAYARTMAEFFALPVNGPPPRFDLILLGLGDDGHTASLFPNAAALNEEQTWVTWSTPGVLPPPVDRVTMTYRTLNAARHVLFLVAGANKAIPLRDVLERKATCEQRPAAGVRPTDGTLTWMVDQAAAALLTRTTS